MAKFLNLSGTACARFITLFNHHKTFFSTIIHYGNGKIFVKKALLLPLLAFLFSFSTLLAQDPILEKGEALEEAKVFPEEDCVVNPCPCEGGYTELKIYYFGDDVVDIEVFGNSGLSILIASFAGVNSGDLLTIDGSSTPIGTFYSKTYLRLTNGLGETCVTDFFSRCPTNAWPGALEDLKIVGKTFGDFTIFSTTDEGNNNECTIADVEQDWHVGGNIVDASNNTMGTRNNEDVTFISNDTPRGVITKAGFYGINTATPAARLDVQGDVIVNETLDVNGIARMNAGVASTDETTGALIVTGGTGISENLNVGNDVGVGNDLDVANNAVIHNDLTVDGITRLTTPVGSSSPTDGTLIVAGGAGFGENINAGNNANIGNNLSVINDGTFGGNLKVSSAPAFNLDLNTGVAGNNISSTGADLLLRTVNTNLIINAEPSDGKVAIGTTNIPDNVMGTDVSGYKLFVQGGILTEEVRIRTDWADFVFEDNYKLRTLAEVKNYIKNNGHLPDMPTAEQVETQGLELGENATIQQVKIEELFLYLIRLDEKVRVLETENAKLKALLQQK